MKQTQYILVPDIVRNWLTRKHKFGQLLIKYRYVKIEYGSERSFSISATIDGICAENAPPSNSWVQQSKV